MRAIDVLPAHRKEKRVGGITVETDTGASYAGFVHFETSDSKWLLEILTDEPTLPICADVLGLDLRPLQNIIVTWWMPNDASQTWEAYEESGWQAPSELITCIDTFVAALDTRPDVFRHLEAVRQKRGVEFLNLSGFTDEEVSNGQLQEELRSLKRVVVLAHQQGATSVRLEGT